MSAKFKAQLSVSATHEGRLVITQKRLHHKTQDAARHYTVSLSRDEAAVVIEQLRRNLALLDELDRVGLA